MMESYLEVTFRRGRALAAYFYLPRQPGDRSERSQVVEPGLVVDFAADGRAIGVEITAPGRVTAATFNAVLSRLGVAPVSAADLAPLQAA